MNFTIISAKQFSKKLKATVHKSGKLGFSDNTAKELGLDNGGQHYIKFAIDDDDKSTLYLINNTEDSEDSFKINKAGNYYYVNTKLMFDALGVTYNDTKYTIIYDLSKCQDTEGEIYKMIKRSVKKRDQDTK